MNQLPKYCGIRIGLDFSLSGFSTETLERALASIEMHPRAKDCNKKSNDKNTAEHNLWEILYGFHKGLENKRQIKFENLPYKCVNCPCRDECYDRTDDYFVKKVDFK